MRSFESKMLRKCGKAHLFLQHLVKREGLAVWVCMALLLSHPVLTLAQAVPTPERLVDLMKNRWLSRLALASECGRLEREKPADETGSPAHPLKENARKQRRLLPHPGLSGPGESVSPEAGTQGACSHSPVGAVSRGRQRCGPQLVHGGLKV